MDRKTLVQNLQQAAKWTKKHQATALRVEDGWNAQNITVGCIQVVNQTGHSIEEWAGCKAGRLDQLQRIQTSYRTRRGNRALSDLIDFARSTLEACCWRSVFWVGALPLGREPRRLSKAHKEALHAGRDRARMNGRNGWVQKPATQNTCPILASAQTL